MPNTVDVTWRIDSAGNPILATGSEYVMNVCTILFNLQPGADEYEPKKGLYIQGKYFGANAENTRDSSYESEIVRQFTTYTDLVPINVMCLYVNKSMHIYLSLEYQGRTYEIELTHNLNELVAVLRN